MTFSIEKSVVMTIRRRKIIRNTRADLADGEITKSSDIKDALYLRKLENYKIKNIEMAEVSSKGYSHSIKKTKLILIESLHKLSIIILI